MGFATFTPAIQEALAAHVRDLHVWDLGAGELEGSTLLLRLGARAVTAVDVREPPGPERGVTFVHSAFADLEPPAGGFEAVLLSWPVNWSSLGLGELVDAARLVLYLGSNTGGNACGTQALFQQHLIHREVLSYLPDSINSLVVYGPGRDRHRPLVGEELALLCGMVVPFEGAEKIAARLAGAFDEDTSHKEQDHETDRP